MSRYVFDNLRVIYGMQKMAVRFPARIYVFGRRAVNHARMMELTR